MVSVNPKMIADHVPEIEVMTVIRATYRRGLQDGRICREVTGYFSMDGELLVESDPCRIEGEVKP